ncbi:MAG: translocation/assembly module TamB domain-containing protein [Gemmatimonadaceae bacterium]
MTRRGSIVLWTAAALITLFSLVVAGFLALTQTTRGREEIRGLIVSALGGQIHGSVYIGRITDGFFTGVTIDSLAIRDQNDSLFVSTGPVSLRYDLRDLADRRILLRGVRAEHPVVYIRQHENGVWNFRQVFQSSTPSALTPQRPAAFVVIDSAVIHNATFVLQLPWHPSHALRGVARDSAIRFELARPDHDIRRTPEGFVRTWRWKGAEATVLHGRVSHPDSAGSFFSFANVRVNESDPPFLFSNVGGSVRQLGDSMWVDVPHFDLPGSTGRAIGKVVWGSDLPVRYDVHVHGDSVSLNDVAWVYPTLPSTGGGTTDLDIRSQKRDPHLTDFILTNMDVRSTRSHLLGTMTFVTGTDTLGVTDVRLAASPVNFDLLRTLNGKPFPYDWQGNITGTVRASGGNLARFKMEDAQVTFADANVPGAVTRATAHGELNILYPAVTAFHNVAVDVASLDLRTLQYLNKNFPRLNGTVYGTAVLDSSWLDVRFHDAQLAHRDGDGPESHATGQGRVTWGEKYLTYDLDLQAQPLAFQTLQKSYPLLPLHASLSGPIRVQGQSPDLLFTTSLTGDGGTLTFDGRVDADPLTYGAHGTGTIAGADLRTLAGNSALPLSALSGTYTVDVSGDSLADLVGTASLALAPSKVAGANILGSTARLRFGEGLVTIDTLVANAAGVAARASGTLATATNKTGTLGYELHISSVRELETLLGIQSPMEVSGNVTLTGSLTGKSGSLATEGEATATGVAVGSAHVQNTHATFAFHNLMGTPNGVATAEADSVVVGIVPLSQARAAVRLMDPDHAQFSVNFVGTGSVTGAAGGGIVRSGERTQVLVDSARVNVDSLNTYMLSAPARVAIGPRGISLDSLILERTRGGSIALRGASLAGDTIHASLRTSGFSLAFLQLFGSTVSDLRGALTANVDVSGTTARPRLYGNIAVENGAATVAPIGTHLDRLDADIALQGDTVRIRRLSAVTNRIGRGTLDITGVVGVTKYSDPTFDLQATARNFRAIDERGLASLDVTTTAPITLMGRYSGAVVGGAIRVDRGTVYIPEVVRKRVVDLNDPELLDVVDTTVARDRAILPHAPSEFTRNLRLQNVAVNIGDDVWLRSEEANIKLGGSLNVTLGRSPATGERSQIALEGELSAVRGTYRLNVVPFVQPTFDVEQGTLRFFGTPDLNPALNITAVNTVRRPRQSLNGQDVRIRATIGGTLASPSLALSSADNQPLSQSDLLSYLITGEPAFTLDYTTLQYVNQLAAVAVRSAGNVITAAIPHTLFDVVELQTPTVLTPASAQAQSENSALYNLLNTRAVFGKQLNSSLFLNFSTGFCAENFRNNLGLRLEYQLGRTYTAQFGIEPGSSDLVCARSGVVQAPVQTPPQIGVDFLRSWRF